MLVNNGPLSRYPFLIVYVWERCHPIQLFNRINDRNQPKCLESILLVSRLDIP
jgi:hypothetical protein